MGMFLQTLFLSGISSLPHLEGEKIYERGQQNLHSQPFTAIWDKSSLQVHVGSTIQENMS